MINKWEQTLTDELYYSEIGGYYVFRRHDRNKMWEHVIYWGA